MRKARLLGLALMAVFAFGVLAAGSAWAKEPAGILYLPGVEGPVEVKGSSETASPLLTTGTDKVNCTKLAFEGELGKGEGTHATLGSLTVTYTGCKELTKSAGCRSENAAGEKDPVETILQTKAGTDLHTVSLENAEGKLAPGLLVGLLEVEAGGKKQDLTLNCGLVKVLVLGATFLEVKGASEGTDVEKVEVEPNNTAKCDKEDKLCATELEKWEAKEGTKNCPLGGRLAETELCGTFTAKPTKVTFSKDVVLDF